MLEWPDSGEILDSVIDALNAFDWAALDRICETGEKSLLSRLENATEPFPSREGLELLKQLRRKRRFRLMTILADALIRAGSQDAELHRQYGQALIDQGNFKPAERELGDIFADESAPARERDEALGLLGRIEIPRIADLESSVVIDLFLFYRAVKGWNEMIAMVGKMSRPLAETVIVQEQLALAMNRAEKGEQAEKILLDLIERRGPSSETYGILGRIYKDRWEAAKKAGSTILARGLADKAIAAYLKGFEADWRDAYPGVNAVALMTLREPPDPRKDELVSIVAYAVKRRIASGKPDYWDYATLLELAVIAGDEAGAADALGNALAAVREIWEPETTGRNLRLIRESRERRGEAKPWMLEIETELANWAALRPQ